MAQASAEKLKQTGLAEWERMTLAPQREQLARTLSCFRQKEKVQSQLSRSTDREIGESQGEREPHLDEEGERGDQRGSMEWKELVSH